MLSRELEQSLNLAIQKARENQHEYITVEKVQKLIKLLLQVTR